MQNFIPYLIAHPTVHWFLLIFFGICFFIFNFLVFPSSSINQYLGKTKILDIRLGYRIEDVIELFEKLGENGRKQYRKDLWTNDLVYPMIYTCLFFLSYIMILKDFPQYKFLVYMSFTTIFFDYFENTNTTILIHNYPKISKSKVKLASMVTLLKWIFAAINILVIIILIFAKIVK